ncbi:MAG: B12-binding domain-containing radical SAM protein [Thiocapsa sp.]|nr:radical SAM protein [Thiocapsa sp.]MCG6986183.1 B12-binding domain-containing radical SAM protein [Thiocapsa sp.]
MKTLLIFPPASDPAHPPLGIPSLAAYLGQRDHEVSLLDLNLLAYDFLLSAEHIEICSTRIGERITAMERAEELRPESAEEYRLMVENYLSADFLRDRIQQAMNGLRDPDSYRDSASYLRCSRVIRRGMELVSAAYHPVRWYPRGFSMSYLPTRSADVLRAIEDRQQNLFLPFFETRISTIRDHCPDVVGLSINYYCQLIPALTLARLLKRQMPGTLIVAGGGLVGFFEDRWSALAAFSDLVDVWIPYEGEQPLDALLGALQRRDPLSTVPGLLRFEGHIPRFVPPGAPPDPALLPPPAFDDLPLNRYLAPRVVLPILGSRGCYWRRCAFCSHYHLFGRRFRIKPVDGILREMKYLGERHGVDLFYFTDECIPPRIARGLAGAIERDGLPYRWFGEFRFERTVDRQMVEKLGNGGCLMLMLGLESASSRVLDLMEKGITPAHAEAILEACAAVGIRTFVMFFIGFPTETRQEAEETIDFIKRLRHEITHIAFSNFVLEQRSPVHRTPRRFGIGEISPYGDEDLKIYSDYRVDRGLSPSEAVAFLDEVRTQPEIRRLIDLYLLSRCHLVFLPPGQHAPPEQTELPTVELVDPASLYPLRSEGLIPITLAFNLDQIREQLRDRSQTGSSVPLRQCPTRYVFSPKQERLVEVGDDGIRLLGACDGRFSVQEILMAVGESNRDETERFFVDLERRGLLRLERHR